MSKKHKRTSGTPPKASGKIWLLLWAVAIAAVAGLWWTSRTPKNPDAKSNSSANNRGTASANVVTNALNFSADDTNVSVIEVAQSMMVTKVLDFGDHMPTPAEVIPSIDRQFKPDDGAGRTFAILEAVGFTNENNKLQVSFRVSTEEPGLGALVFKRTGEVLWRVRVTPRAGPPPADKQLTVMLEDDTGKQVVVDGSKNPSTILDAAIHQSPMPMREYWPNGEERTLTFIYSACGCPVKTKVRRLGEKTARTTLWPALFPDDSDAMRVINTLMGWPDDGIPRNSGL